MQKTQEYRGRASIEELDAFIAVIETGSFTEAARALERDATIISRRVSR
ncbi:LysR family transcriptional regulator [Massilia dura]|uniref:LysR family transcriptional regulator n=1 Tax=Pseudoduganella dura TaxID=321982 RepID=A0A6I3XLN7_9BURK|nr:LysR family transcriptional regulator [Pseudoduganella dura]MUI15353.1 LysR family transcriptional regulator [Pseudoduganella dura]